MVQLDRIPVLFFFFNPAPLHRLPEGEKIENQPPGTHRDNTPWCVSIPSLGVTVQAVDDHGEPICGYWDHNEAIDWGVGLWNQLTADPTLLDKIRANPEAPLEVSNDPKVMQRTVHVRAPSVV